MGGVCCSNLILKIINQPLIYLFLTDFLDSLEDIEQIPFTPAISTYDPYLDGGIVDDIDALRDAQPVDEFEVPKDSENVLLTRFQKLLIQTLEGLRSDVKSISNPQSQVEKVTTENFAFFEN